MRLLCVELGERLAREEKHTGQNKSSGHCNQRIRNAGAWGVAHECRFALQCSVAI